MATVKVTSENFEKEVLQSEQTVLVDFWASWCGPCKMIAPTLEEISEEGHDFKICKVNVDEDGALAQKFGVMSIPTLIVFKNGAIVKQEAGLRPKAEILEMVK